MLKFTPEVLYGVNALNIKKSAHLIGDTLTTVEGNISEFLIIADDVSVDCVCMCDV